MGKVIRAPLGRAHLTLGKSEQGMKRVGRSDYMTVSKENWKGNPGGNVSLPTFMGREEANRLFRRHGVITANAAEEQG